MCVRTLTGQRRKLKCRSADDPCSVDLNAMVFVDCLLFHVFGRKERFIVMKFKSQMNTFNGEETQKGAH